MGLYVNPVGQSKEDWLKENGLCMFYIKPDWNVVGENDLPVCLMNNGPFTAAGIAYSESELNAFSGPDDPRPKTWYIVPIAKLIEITPGLKEMIQK